MSEHVGLTIKRLREERKLSKSRLSREAGVSDPYIVQIEKGDRSPSRDVLIRIARVLRVPPHTLLVPAGLYSPEEVKQAETSAKSLVASIQQHASNSELQPDLYDRYLAREYDQVDYFKTQIMEDIKNQDRDDMDLPADVYWGWNQPLGTMPPESWDKLSDSDRRLVQKLINRIALTEDPEA